MMRMSHSGAGTALATTLVAAFVLCAIAQAILPGLQFSHMWLSLFTGAPLGSWEAWIEGILASAIVGLVAGHIFAHTYNWWVSRKA